MPITLNGDTGIVSPAIDVTTPITVSDGGTGLSSPGTSGNILTSNGTAWTSAAAPAGGFGNIQVFTSSGTFNVPAGITKAKVTVVGGGGSGVSSTTSGAGGGGGVAIEVVTGLTPGGTVTVTVGGAGGTSSFGAFCSATAGSNGVSGGAGGAGGTGSGGNINIQGQAGNPYNVSTGGNSLFGFGAVKPTGTAGVVGQLYGGGGSGASGQVNSAGGAGAAGIVVVEY
jgi:hypothetical protein